MRFLTAGALAAVLALPAAAQQPTGAPETRLVIDTTAVSVATMASVPAGSIPLTVEAAEAIALERGYAIRLAELDVATAQAQVRQQYGTLYPNIALASSYTRNVVQANPFAGSSAGGIFGGLGAIGWLQYNETARTDGDPATNPITLAEYNARVGAGQNAVGYNPANGSNPFGTDNSFLNTVSVTQPLYSGTAFAALRGAKDLVEVSRQAALQRRDEALQQARQAFYGALLAEAQIGVRRASVQRSRETAGDAALLVAQGVRPVLERLNADVDLANAETALVQGRGAGAGDARPAPAHARPPDRRAGRARRHARRAGTASSGPSASSPRRPAPWTGGRTSRRRASRSASARSSATSRAPRPTRASRRSSTSATRATSPTTAPS